MLLLTSILSSLSIFVLIVGVAQLRSGSEVSERLNSSMMSDSVHPLSFQEVELARPFSERVLLPLVQRLSRLIGWIWPENRLKALQLKLLMAGNPGRLRAIDFIGVRMLTGGGLLGMAVLYGYLTSYPLTFTSMAMLAALGFCGFFLPDVWLSRQISRRQADVTNSLPDALDMLVITSEAGLSFESGLQEIMSKWDNELSREFARVLRDIGMGQSRRHALNGFSDRTGVPDVQSFVAALNQAEELGVSIGRVLRAQSEDMRVRRRQRAYEKANQAPVKIMFPLVFLIFPAIFAVLLGPAVPQLIAFGG
ncbi:MAG: type II secretion system F family protein [Oscillochloris sp.]|nr:type II secretion system F family protein [Oscillochloris sp.]